MSGRRPALLLRALAPWAATLLLAGSAAADDQVIEHWFTRHRELEWQPLVARWDEVKAAMKAPVENLALPLDYYPSGRVKARLKARQAQIFLDGMIFAEDVLVEMLTDDGRPDGHLTAEGCLFDRQTKRGYCRGRVGVEKESDRLKGSGMYFSIDEQFIRILADCEIRTRRMHGNFGRIW